MSGALAYLGVHKGEERSAALMGAHSFFMGCSTVFFETAASAFFLSRFESHVIPWVYLAAAVVNIVTGTIYSRVQGRVSFARLMKGTLWFLFVTVLMVRLGFAVSSAAWVVFGGLVWYRVVSSLTDLEYWAVAGRIYDVRQAKRLFGLVGTGEVIARTAGAFSVPFLVRLGGVGNLMLLSAAGLGLCLVLLGAVLRPVAAAHALSAPGSALQRGGSARAGIRQIAKSPYLTLVVSVAVLATFGKYFVDFAFLEQLSTRTKVEADLATYLGIFSGLTQTISLLTRLFVSRPLLNRFGIRVGVMVLPLLHLACTAAILATGILGSGALVFWFVLGNQGIYKSFKHPIDNASFKVLYQPLKPSQRLAAQIAVEVVFAPVVVGVAGAVMLLFSAGMRYDPVRFAGVLLVNFAIWAWLARSAGRGYMRALLDMLRRRIGGNEPLDLDDGTTLSVVRARLDSPAPVEAVFALHLLEKSGAPGLVEALLARAAHPAPEVRQYVIERLLELDPSALRELRVRLSADPAPSVRGAALKAFAQNPEGAATEELLPYLEDGNPFVQRVVIALLFGARDAEGRAAARAAVERLAASDRPEDRGLAARLAGDHGLAGLLAPLLADPDPGARRLALAAAGRLREPALQGVLFDHLGDPRFAETAVAALGAEGEAVLPELARRFEPGASRLLLARLARVYALAGGAGAVAGLLAQVDFPDPAVRGAVLSALDRLRYVADGAGRAALRRLLREESGAAAWTLGALRDLDGIPGLEALRGALEDEVAEARRRLFSAVACVHDRLAIDRARDHLGHASKDKRAYALEVFDLVLDSDEREEVLPLLDLPPPAGRLARLAPRFPQAAQGPDERLHQLIERPERWLRGFTRALAIRAAAERGLDHLAGTIGRLASADPLVRESAAWAVEHLGGRPPRKEGRRMLLIEKIILLKTVQMFATTSEELLAEIAAILEEVEVKAGEVVFDKGDGGDGMYIVVTGRVRVFDGETTISVLGEREIFGELALLDPEPRSASVAAAEDAQLFRLDRETFSQLMAGNLEIVLGVLHVLCERLRRTSAAAALGH